MVKDFATQGNVLLDHTSQMTTLTEKENDSFSATPILNLYGYQQEYPSQDVSAESPHWVQQMGRAQLARQAGSPHHHARTAAATARAHHVESKHIPGNQKRTAAEQQTVEGWSSLDLGGVGLLQVSKSLFSTYRFLTVLYLNHNQLTQVDPAIGSLTHLVTLDLSCNQIEKLPPDVGMLTNLRELLLFDNLLKILPPEIGSLYQLNLLGIEGNPLEEGVKMLLANEGFRLLEKTVVEYNQVAMHRSDLKTKDMYNRLMNKDNVAIIALLEHRERRTPIVVANSHIHWDPACADVKLIQVSLLTHEIASFMEQHGVKDTAPVILCGDFNSEPSSSVYELLSKGQIAKSHPDLLTFSYGAFTAEGLQQPLKLESAYSRIGELQFTNYTPQFKGVLDYIWHSTTHLGVSGLLGPIEEDFMVKIVGLPDPHFPSERGQMTVFVPPKSGQTGHKDYKILLTVEYCGSFVNLVMSVAVGTPVCASLDCTREAHLQCPTCLKQANNEHSFFCSQDCFKKSWGQHKTLHASTKKQYDPFPTFNYTGPLRPVYPLSPRRIVPASIAKPDYAETGIPRSEFVASRYSTIKVHTPEEIEGIRKACKVHRKVIIKVLNRIGLLTNYALHLKITREVLDIAAKSIRIGITTDEIDRIVHEATIERGAYPSPLNYNYFPKSCCTCYCDGFHGDANGTYLVGNVDEVGRKLVETTRECLDKAIAMVKPGVRYRDFGKVIEEHATKNGFSVVRAFCGHGINQLFHCAPNVPHYANNKAVGIIRPGHIFTIEPMICEGAWQDHLWPDNWTATTKDGKRSAQFEHTLLVTETGVEILT
ncbi:Methionine aminopeptidase 1 [Apophysomyces ossiformis]|uniref:poly(A)-specific ribonuclease n=1 Tax=Apophysomyces ossiformis TaxID=679940 RepID=A0A8H7ELC5_9FUNG|nr:Methionine aminopeptidase 1 [Apophysomyces ossiformis]